MAWNGAQEMLFLLFQRLTMAKPDISEGIFFALKSDAAQRDITIAAAKGALKGEENEATLKAIKSAIKRLGNLASERNETVHTMWHWLIMADENQQEVVGRFVPRFVGERITELFRSDLPDYAQKYEDLATQLNAIGAEIFALVRKLAEQKPSPDKSPQPDQPQTPSSEEDDPPTES